GIRVKLVTGVQTCALPIYLRVIAAMWMAAPEPVAVRESTGRPALVGGAADAPVRAGWEVYATAAIFAAATLFFGIFPSPLFDFRSEERRVGKEWTARWCSY